MEVLENINSFIWFPILFLVFLAASVILTAKYNFLQFRFFRHIMSVTFGSFFARGNKNKDTVTPFKAVSAALAGTMGVGNIAGVAAAIYSGGAGTVFWMWISAVFCMILKYAEVVLAVKYRKKKTKEGKIHITAVRCII